MAAGAVLFALMNFFARLASSSASWACVGAVRALIGAAVAFAVARSRGASLVATDRRALFWRSAFGTASMLGTFYALSSQTLSLGDTVTLFNLSPVLVALLAPLLLREQTTPATAIAIALSLGGVVLVLRPAFLFGDVGGVHAMVTSGPSLAASALSAVLAAVFSSIAMVMLRRAGQTESPEAIAFHFSLFAFVVMSIIALFDPRLPTLRDAGFMIAAGVAAGVAQIAMSRAYAVERAARVGSMSYLAVVASALLGALVLGERPSVLAIGGMALVVLGGLVAMFARGT